MAKIPTFGTDGIRGVANDALTPEVAVALGRAAAEVLGGSRAVIGRDTRRSGHMIEAGLVAGYTAAGVDVELLGVVPTPTVAWAAGAEATTGAMISASHNPYGDNGIKLFASGGLKLTDDVEAQVQQRFAELLTGDASDGSAPTGADVGVITDGAGSGGWLESVVGSVSPGALGGMNLVLDAANGSAFAVAQPIFERLGATVTLIGADPTGVNINDGVGSTSPDLLCETVVSVGADAGLAFDGDADRLIAVDGNGTVVDGDRVLALLAVDWQQTGRLAGNTVVVTVMSNLGFHRAMAAAKVDVVTTGVGDRYVLEALNGGPFSLGGEQSGHVICRDIATTGDGVLAGVQLMDVVARSGSSLADLAEAAMTTVPQVLKNVRLPQRDPELIGRLQQDVAAAEEAMGDDGRILVRASGTEPLMRVMVEHVDADTADEVCDQLIQRVHELIKS